MMKLPCYTEIRKKLANPIWINHNSSSVVILYFFCQFRDFERKDIQSTILNELLVLPLQSIQAFKRVCTSFRTPFRKPPAPKAFFFLNQTPGQIYFFLYVLIVLCLNSYCTNYGSLHCFIIVCMCVFLPYWIFAQLNIRAGTSPSLY